jgi:diguanylate cyclase (GGDEF)-like protein
MHIQTKKIIWQKDREERQSAASRMTNRFAVVLVVSLAVICAGIAAAFQAHAPLHAAVLFLALFGLAWMPVSGWLLARLYRRVRASEIDDRELEAQRQIELFRAARRDSLTGLPSRPVFAEVLSGLAGSGRPSALLVIDIDRFSEINATYGDSTGDTMLRAVGDRLRTIAGQREHVGRLDGDEFALVVDKPEELKHLAETTAQILRQMMEPYPAGGMLLDLSFSIGMARAPEHGTTAETLLRAARLALQSAKSEGGGVWRLCGQDESDQLRRRIQLRQELSQAIASGQIIPWYQPIVRLPENTIAKFEVLARWQHPTLGVLEPEDFIPMAEELGLAGYLSMALLRQVALDLLEWPEWCRFAINASAGQLRELISFVRTQPGDWQRRMDLSRLDVEITETALMRDRNMVRELIDVLHEHGARAGLDNFGSGYSNFFHLRELPFDTIKIGKSFISEMLIDPRAESCVLAMIWLGHGLGIDMVADGVENAEIADRLAKMGCHFAQGFHYAHPVPAEEVAGLLHESDMKAKQQAAQPVYG